MKSCIFCDTPLQVMNVILLKENVLKNDNVDLYVVRNFRDADVIIENLKKIKIFDNIFVLDTNRLKKSVFTWNGECKKIVQHYFSSLYFRILLGENIAVPNDYDNIFLGSITPYGLTMIYHCKQANVYLYDDGFNSYAGRAGMGEMNRRLSSFRKCIYKILGENIERYFPFGIYVHRPDFCKTLWTQNILPLMGKESNRERIFSLISSVFPYERDEVYEKCQYIYLSQPIDLENQEKLNLNLKIEEILKKNKVVFRRHPREKVFADKDVIAETKHNLWEMVCKNQITDKHCLICNCSTAALMPKLLFGKEPKLVFFLPMFAKFYQEREVEEKMGIIERVRNFYSDSRKIVLVNNLEELAKEISAVV